MQQDVILMHLERFILLKEKVRNLCNDIISYSLSRNILVVNDYVYESKEEYILRKSNEWLTLEEKIKEYERYFSSLDKDTLYKLYETIALAPKDSLKAAKLEYLFGLMDNINEKEMVR